jgi:hypothetical protein
MTPLALRLWGGVWTGQLALAASCALEWFQLLFAPWYRYFEIADLAPLAIMLTLSLLARSRFRIVALIVWILLSLSVSCAAVTAFPHWGNGITDAPPNVEARYVSLSAASETLMFFAALVFSGTGMTLLMVEVFAQRRRSEQ